MRQINYNCRNFIGDMPCHSHKEHGILCNQCQFYEPVTKRILIIKLAAAGDVLRTTCLTPAIKEKWPGCHITWITQKQSLEFFINNHYVDRIIDIENSYPILTAEGFDLAINLDASDTSSRLATKPHVKEKLGFVYHADGYVYPIKRGAK
jgi:ADP-heptose:LPS heptosyltransferase